MGQPPSPQPWGTKSPPMDYPLLQRCVGMSLGVRRPLGLDRGNVVLGLVDCWATANADQGSGVKAMRNLHKCLNLGPAPLLSLGEGAGG